MGTSTAQFSYGVASYTNNPTVWPNGIPDGTQYASINAGSIFQNVNAFLTAGMTYNFTGYIGQHLNQTGSGELSLYTVNGTLLASSPEITPVQGTFVPVTVSYTVATNDPNIGSQLQIRASKFGPDFGNTQTDVDALSLTQAQSQAAVVPESSSFALLGLALPALGLMARRRVRM